MGIQHFLSLKYKNIVQLNKHSVGQVTTATTLTKIPHFLEISEWLLGLSVIFKKFQNDQLQFLLQICSRHIKALF